MATTGELRAIMQEMHMVEIGDAASYLGEEVVVEEEELLVSVQPTSTLIPTTAHPVTHDNHPCQVLYV